MPLSERSRARVQLEANFFVFMAAGAAVIGTALPLGIYLFDGHIDVEVPRIVGASVICFVIAFLLFLVGASWLTKLEDK